MKDVSPILLQRIPISPIHWDTPLQVALLPYLRFTRSINRQLRELIVRHAKIRSATDGNFRRSRPPH